MPRQLSGSAAATKLQSPLWGSLIRVGEYSLATWSDKYYVLRILYFSIWHAGSQRCAAAHGHGLCGAVPHVWRCLAWHHLRCHVRQLGPQLSRVCSGLERVPDQLCGNHGQARRRRQEAIGYRQAHCSTVASGCFVLFSFRFSGPQNHCHLVTGGLPSNLCRESRVRETVKAAVCKCNRHVVSSRMLRQRQSSRAHASSLRKASCTCSNNLSTCASAPPSLPAAAMLPP